MNRRPTLFACLLALATFCAFGSKLHWGSMYLQSIRVPRTFHGVEKEFST